MFLVAYSVSLWGPFCSCLLFSRIMPFSVLDKLMSWSFRVWTVVAAYGACRCSVLFSI